MTGSIYNWDVVAANNGNSDPDATWAEGMAPSAVNNSGRSDRARVRQLLTDIGGSIAAGGTANGLTVTAASAFTSYADGQIIAFRATASNTGAATLNVNGIGAKAIRKMDATGDVALMANEIRNTGIYVAQYQAALNGAAGAWLLVNPTPANFATLDGAQTLTHKTFPEFIGITVDFAGTVAPTKWLLCFGQAISRTTYAALFAILGTTYGAGDGSTTFNLPDIRGRVVAGQDDMGGTSANRLTGQTGGIDGDPLGTVGGAETHTLTTAQLAAHTHGIAGNTVYSSGLPFMEPGALRDKSASTITSISTGSDQPHNNVQPTIILNKIIYAGV